MRKFKNEILYVLLTLAAIIGSIVYDARGQSTLQRLSTPCASTTTKGEIKFNAGNIDLNPCPSKSLRINGVVFSAGITSLNGSTASTQTFSIGSADTALWGLVGSTHNLQLPITSVSGSSRTNFFPYFNAANTLAKSPFSWDGTSFTFNNTALNAEFTELFTPNNTTGIWKVGDHTTTPTDYITLDKNLSTIKLSGQTVNLGDLQGQGLSTYINIVDSAETITLSGISSFRNHSSGQTPLLVNAVVGQTGNLATFQVNGANRAQIFANGQVRINDGSLSGADLALSFNTATTSGFSYSAGIFGVFTNNNRTLSVIDGGGLSIGANNQYIFNSQVANNGAADTAFGRFSAGVVKLTDSGANIRGLFGGGAAVASAAALPLPTGRVFHVTGTTAVTSITSTNFQAGVCITLIFDDALTFTDGGNLKLAGNFVTTADDTISLCYDGLNWFETARAVN